MNTKRFLCAALGAVCCFAFMQAQVRTEQTFEKGWKFTREDNAEFANPGYNDSKWQNVTVPHDWAIYGPFSINNDKQEMAITQDGQTEAMEHAGRTGGLPFVGTGWYRLNFDAPGFEKGKKATLISGSKIRFQVVLYLVILKPKIESGQPPLYVTDHFYFLLFSSFIIPRM